MKVPTMPVSSFAGSMTVILCALLTCSLSSCGRSSPEKVADGTSPADRPVAPLVNNAQAPSVAANAPLAASKPTAPAVTTPVIVANAALPSPIGPGHFNGRRETGSLLLFDRNRPDSWRWLEYAPAGLDWLPVASRFGASGETVVSLRNSQTVILSQVKTGLTQSVIARAESANANPVTALFAAPEGVIICGTKSGAVEFWKAGSSAPISVAVAKGAITALAETPNGNHLLAGDAEGNTTWLDPQQVFSPTQRHEQTARVGAAAVSPDGRLAATASDDRSIVLWDVAKRSRVAVLQGHGHPVRAVAFSPDSKRLASGDREGTVIIWNVPSGEQAWSVALNNSLVQLQREPTVTPTVALNNQAVPRPAADPGSRNVFAFASEQGISAVAFSGDQCVLAVGTATGYTQTFDLTHRRELSVVHHQAPIGDLAFAADGASLLVATTPGNVSRCWQAPSGPRMLSGHQGSVRFAALDASGHRAVTGGQDKRLCVWDVDQGSLLQSLDNAGEAIVSGAISRDGRRAVTGSYGSGVVFWDLNAGKRLAKRYGHGKRVLSFAFSPDGNFVASGCEDQTVRIWDFVSQKTKHTITHDAAVHYVAFSPNGAKLLTSTIDPRGWQFPARLRLWEAATGRPLNELKGHRAVVNAAVFSTDGRSLTSCGADGQLCRWTVANGERTHDSYRPDGLSHAGLIDDGRLLVVRRFNSGVIIYSTVSMARLSEFDVPTRSVGDLGVAAQGNRVIAGTEEGPVYVWSIGHE